MSEVATEAPAVGMRGISKAFGGIRALQDVDLVVKRGEVHALLGENGAGKSTLLKVLRGVIRPDAGSVEIEGRRLLSHDPQTSRRAGVAMIFQETSLVPTLSAAENIFLNREPRNRMGLIDDRQAVDGARTLLDEFGVSVDPSAPVAALGAGQRQLIEIVKAISERSRILILDEPTSALSGAEVERLFVIVKRLKGDGVAMIYVSHRMDEILRIADRATVLRDGRRVVTAAVPGLTVERLVEHVVGAERKAARGSGSRTAPPGAPLLELRSVSDARKLREVDLVVRRGEVVGVAGLLGSGRSSLARVLYGEAPRTSGEVRLAGRKTEIRSPRDAIEAGIALVPEDRLRQGVIAQHSLMDNVCLPVLDRLSRGGWLSTRAMALAAEEQMTKLRIKATSSETQVGKLSGGNQQKVALAKWLGRKPEILILDEPTAGIDVGAKNEIADMIRALARDGVGILLISSEPAELIATSDRILVMGNGRVLRSIECSELQPPDAAALAPAECLLHAERQLQMAMQAAHAGA